MRRRSTQHVTVTPCPQGWHLLADGSDGRVEGVVRVHAVTTWMQQRRAVEERLRSWDLPALDGAPWRRRPDGSYRVPVAVTTEARSAA